MRRNSLRRIGAALVDARRRHGWTQAEVARRAGVSRRWIGDVEAGRRPGAELSRLLDVMDVLELEAVVTPGLEVENRAEVHHESGTAAAASQRVRLAEDRLRELGVL